MLEILIGVLIVTEIIIVGVLAYNTISLHEFHKNEVGYNKYLRTLLDNRENAFNKMFECTQEIIKGQEYIANEILKIVKKGK